ncbi:MAG: CoA transferase [Bifidobacteriaceae bacterium]|jgi:crotonobetainyl-CoA:carnitine CoA-transferase CaiB-like acyl-CoA transferase|nr:CoA transferase [Bifidobacteriaceae bacterium]
MADGILKGLRVVELATLVAVPYAGRALADMGAEVIKVETLQGEIYRGKAGMLFGMPNAPKHDYIFTPYNVNKLSVSLNLKAEAGMEAFRKLLATADIFLTNNREAALERLGLGLDALREEFPSMIIASVSGFGRKGPEKDRGGYDATSFWSPAGPIQEWTAADGRAFKPFYGFGDSVAAAHLTASIMAALYHRERTGQGDLIRSSLLGTGLWTNIGGIMRYQAGQTFPKDFYEPPMPLDNFYKTKDGKWFITSEENWDTRCHAYFDLFGTPELADDPAWTTQKGYLDPATRREKAKFFEAHIAQVTSQEITEKLAPAGCIFEFLYETDQVVHNQQAWENDYFRHVVTQDGTDLVIANLPCEHAAHPRIEKITPAPLLGEHTAQLLASLGYSEAELGQLENAGVIRVDRS